LEGANFSGAKLKDVDFSSANLEGVNFSGANLEGANFSGAKLKDAKFWETQLVDQQGVGPSLADVQGWEGVNLSLIEWSQIKRLGEEALAKKEMDEEGERKGKTIRVLDYHRAARAYRQVATALEGQGLKEEAGRFAYSAQAMQRRMLRYRIRQPKRRWRQRLTDLVAFLFSGGLNILSGYGYHFERTVFWYLVVLGLFMGIYLSISCGLPASEHLEWGDALILSVSNMVGRGFFRQDLSLSDPYAAWSVVEGVFGVFMDVVLISTLTQWLFKK
jgi:hypothetical protein